MPTALQELGGMSYCNQAPFPPREGWGLGMRLDLVVCMLLPASFALVLLAFLPSHGQPAMTPEMLYLAHAVSAATLQGFQKYFGEMAGHLKEVGSVKVGINKVP